MLTLKLKRTIIVCTLLLVIVALCTTVYFFSLTSKPAATAVNTNSSSNYHSGFTGNSGSKTFIEVDPTLQPFIQITAPRGGTVTNNLDYESLGGTVTWIGKANDPVQSLQNIHLVMYTRWEYRNSTENFPDASLIGVHIAAYPNEPTLPTDTYDHTKVIIPNIGVNAPTFDYDLNCMGPNW